jgi:hypothetical protein
MTTSSQLLAPGAATPEDGGLSSFRVSVTVRREGVTRTVEKALDAPGPREAETLAVAVVRAENEGAEVFPYSVEAFDTTRPATLDDETLVMCFEFLHGRSHLQQLQQEWMVLRRMWTIISMLSRTTPAGYRFVMERDPQQGGWFVGWRATDRRRKSAVIFDEKLDIAVDLFYEGLRGTFGKDGDARDGEAARPQTRRT